MQKAFLTSLLVVVSFLTTPTFASQAFSVGWDKFHIQAPDIELKGTESDDGITSLTILVFNKKFRLKQEQINQLKGYTANGLQISGETGFANFGGMTYYINLKSNINANEIIWVVISKQNGLIITQKL